MSWLLARSGEGQGPSRRKSEFIVLGNGSSKIEISALALSGSSDRMCRAEPSSPRWIEVCTSERHLACLTGIGTPSKARRAVNCQLCTYKIKQGPRKLQRKATTARREKHNGFQAHHNQHERRTLDNKRLCHCWSVDDSWQTLAATLGKE